MNDLSRRSVAKGAAWAIPTAVIAVGAPAYAASTCTGAVDEAFAAVSSGLTAYWTEIDGGNLNGTAKQVYFNINNHSPYSVLLTDGSQFQIRFDLINSDRTGLNQDRLNLTQSTTSWGSMSPVVGGTTDNGNGTSVNSATTTWTTAANGTTSIPAQGNNNDNTADMTISAPGNSIIKATLVSVPSVKPSWESIVAANPNLPMSSCRAYYDNKAAVPMPIRIAGNLMGGTAATYGQQNGVDTTLGGGSAAWAVGVSYWSDRIGNYLHDGNASTSPRISTLYSYSRDGIF